MRRHAIAALLTVLASSSASADTTTVMRCGASAGHAHYFEDGGWVSDGISKGKIVLVWLGEDEWDILFDDAVRPDTYGYRKDGATVMRLGVKPGEVVTIGAFHPNYTDVYTFDLVRKEVAWSSNKIGPIAAKVGSYLAKCE